jgi:dTDP-4-dehydrorhamnose reductase
MLGTDLVAAFAEKGHVVEGLQRADLDITDRGAVERALSGADVVVNAAAYTDVDGAESHKAEAFAVNAKGAENLAYGAALSGARFVTVSTDYVFDGAATTPYAENAPRSPVSVYGRSKAEGEERVLAAHPGAYVVRTAWLYGRHGGNFPRTIVRLASTHPTISVVTDQLGQPTWTADLALQIDRLLEAGAPSGVYHATNSGQASWFEFARAVFEAAGLDPERVLPTDRASFAREAPRPMYSVLGHDRWDAVGIQPMRAWSAALSEAASSGVLQS